MNRISMREAVFLSFLLIALNASSPALDPNKALTQYQEDFWGEEDGLPQASVQAITQSKNGYVWIGTRDGLARFDGSKFTIYRGETYPGLKSDDIRSLCEDSHSRLWVGTFNGGVSCLENSAFRAFATSSRLSGNGVLDIYEDSARTVWLGAWRGIFRFNSGKFDAFAEAEGVHGKSVWAFWEDGGALRAATERAIHIFQNSRFQLDETLLGTRLNNIRKVYRDRKGTLWIGTLNGLIRVRENRTTLFTQQEGLTDDRVRAITEDSHGNIWVGTWEGLNRIQNDLVSSTRPGERLHGMIEALCVDADGSLWIGMRGTGLARLRDAKFANFTMREGLPSKLPRCVFQAKNGAVWIGTDGGGLSRIDGGQFSNLAKLPNLPSDFVATVAEGHDGMIWAGLGRPAGIVGLRDGMVDRAFSSANGLPFEYSVRALFIDRDGILWAGGDGPLCRIVNGQIQLVAGLPGPPVRIITQDRDGQLWVGCDDGLCVLRGTNLVSVFTTQHGLSHKAVYSFHQDQSGTIWLGTQRGLTRYKNGEFRALPKAKGGFQGTIYQVLEDDDETLWSSSSKGISAVKKTSLEAVLDGRAEVLESVTFGTADGLTSTQCQGGSQSPGCRTRDGRLWFATLNGVAVVQPGAADPHQKPPPVLIEEIRANRRSCEPARSHRFAADTDDFEFHYTALKFITPEKVQFRFQLVGNDKDWVQAGTRRTAYYNNLRPGSYRFRVCASSDGVNWSKPVETASFVLLPHFYQTNWFYLLCGFLVVGCGWGFHRTRMQAEKERFALVLAERMRIARDLHDTMAQGFAGTAFQLEALRSNLSSGHPESKRHLDLAITMVRHSFSEAKRAVLKLRSPGLQNGSLVSAVSQMGRQMLADTGIELAIDTRGAEKRLEPETEEELLRICQEALANAVKHSNASRVELSFDFANRSPLLSIRDDGVGFNPEMILKSNGHHFGLLGMRERVKQLGGTLEIQTFQGKGTEISVFLTSTE